ncbi:2OG-Fe(II) oxygenase superfamily protein [Sarocladium implicatum]|nr:2OG-Fe(II) oxygenase superfamily protein [Sarocladium implicatum]
MAVIKNNDFPTASLKTIKYSALENKDPQELENLMIASRDEGFFYLDFKDSSASSLPDKKRELLKVMKQYFDQPRQVKQEDSTGTPTRGYVAKGTFTADNVEQPDESFEHLAISTYELQATLKGTLPRLYQEAGSLVHDYITTCQRVVTALLSCYNTALALEGASELEQHHVHTKASESILALLSYPGQLTHQKHTDLGSLTILFSDQWDLQVVAPASGEWEWIEPREEDAVINVGDALRFLSGKRLYSCVHRVIRDGRAREEGHRYSIAYLLRPNDEAVFRDADGTEITARDLAKVKYNTYSASHVDQAKSTVLMGGMDRVLGVKV